MPPAMFYFVRHQILVLEVFVALILLCGLGDAQNQGMSATCAPFPHANLHCGQYIDANTVVYVDTNVFNYTEINNAIKRFNETAVFGITLAIGDSCAIQLNYMVCQYVYPRCDPSTQMLLPMCEQDCSHFTGMCAYGFRTLRSLANTVEPIAELFIINCTDQFSTFASANISVNTEDCYDLYVAPTFLNSSTSDLAFEDNPNIRFVHFGDDNTYSAFCSEFKEKLITVSCTVTGNPQPVIEVFRIDFDGSRNNPLETFRSNDEVAIGLNGLKFGEIIILYCRASNIVATLNITFNLTYTCCSDDNRSMEYSLGQEFMTTNCCQCLCGDGGNISCDLSTCGSSSSPQCDQSSSGSGDSGISAVIVVIVVVLVLIVVTLLVVVIIFCAMKKKKKMEATVTSSQPFNPITFNNHTLSTVKNEKVLLSAMNFPLSGEIFNITTEGFENKVDEDDLEDTDAFARHEDSISKDEIKESLPHSASHTLLDDLLTSCREEEFKPTVEIITKAMIDHRLEEFMISCDSLTILKGLGEGAFGKVFQGHFKDDDNTDVEVAVKTMKDCSSMDDLNLFISESVIMKDFKHRNVLGLVGVSVGVEEDKAVPYIIIPFMANGDLKGYLKDKRTAAGRDVKALFKELNCLTLVKMCCDICNGMKYLASIKFVHRDLAARNCMVDKDLVIKVADFGLARDIYADEYYRLGHAAKVPIKWMPLESIHDRYYNQKTDVWAFGVVCWEVFSLGRIPYGGLDNQNLPEYLESGRRLSKPALCSEEIFEIMSSCWQLNNSDRPAFSTLAEQLEQHYSDVMESNPSDSSSPYHNLFDETAYVNWKPE